MICPKCHTDRAHRAHRTGIREHIAALFSRHPYRCHECGFRFLVNRYGVVPSDGPLTPAEREIRNTRTALRRQRSRREFLLYTSALLLFLLFLYFITRERTPQSD